MYDPATCFPVDRCERQTFLSGYYSFGALKFRYVTDKGSILESRVAPASVLRFLLSTSTRDNYLSSFVVMLVIDRGRIRSP